VTYWQRITQRPTILQLRLWAGLILGSYVTLHLSNHALGLISVHAQETARPWIMWFWHSPLGQLLLYGSLTLHSSLGLYSLMRRRHYRIPKWEIMQLVLGLSIPYLLLVHIVNTRGTRILTRIDIDYVYEIANLWVDPATRFRQVALVLLVWVHFAIGIHFWLRIKPWYRRAFPVILIAMVMIPMVGLLGFAETGMKMTAKAGEEPQWFAAIKKHGVPSDPERAKIRANLKAWVGDAWLGVVFLAFCFGQIRNWAARGRRFIITYPGHHKVEAPLGMSILEVSRMAGLPHMSVCGGRARCTTCRVRIIHASGRLPAPTVAEDRVLQRIGAPPNLRLACQTRPCNDLTIHPLLNPTLASPPPPGQRGPEFGEEREVTVLFVDVRHSTQLAESRLPYDVVFVLNYFFAEMAEAVEQAGGHYSNFTGDGLMALFGLRRTNDKGAHAALSCANDMLQRLQQINQRLADELDAPIRIGIGVHTGIAIIGRMGPPKQPIISALGDTVNTAARVESFTKEISVPLVVSAQTLQSAGLVEGMPLTDVQLRGRHSLLTVAIFNEDTISQLLAPKVAQPVA
jgi:adenylate cyclase